jgi:hypothetical protein
LVEACFQPAELKLLHWNARLSLERYTGLIPIAENANDSRIQGLILGSRLIERLRFLLQSGEIDETQVPSESAFSDHEIGFY